MLWASIRIRGMNTMARDWTVVDLHGCRPGRRAGDVWMDLALTVEPAKVGPSGHVDRMEHIFRRCRKKWPSSGGIHPRVLRRPRRKIICSLEWHHLRLLFECAAA